MNRRDLLKWFGAGAVAVPVINGMPKTEATAVIVHQPVIEVPPPPRILTGNALQKLGDAFYQRDICEVSVYIRRKGENHSVRINCEGYISKFSIFQDRQFIDITSDRDQCRKFLPVLANTKIECTGEPEVVEGGLTA